MEENGVQYEIRNQNYGGVPEGHVIYTNPSWGYEVRAGVDTVVIHVSIGPEVVWRTVPDVRGMSLENARLMLELHNLRIGDVSYVETDEVAEIIVAQEPMGTMEAEGTAINLVISRGAQLRRVAITIGLPMHIDHYVMVVAVQDGVVVQEEELNPALAGSWRPFFSGTDQLAFIEIFIDGVAYRQYHLDFEPETPTFQEVRGLVGDGLLPPPPPPQSTPFVYGQVDDQPYEYYE